MGNRPWCDLSAEMRRVAMTGGGHLAILEMRSQRRRRAKWPQVALCPLQARSSHRPRHRRARTCCGR
jgi:hypothetical protein